MRQELQQVKQFIYDDGAISDDEVKYLRGLLDGGNVGEEEVRLLLDLNNILSGDHNPGFDDLFVEKVSAFVRDGGNSVSGKNWAWLKTHMLRDGKVDALEKRLLADIAAKADNPPDELASYLE